MRDPIEAVGKPGLIHRIERIPVIAFPHKVFDAAGTGRHHNRKAAGHRFVHHKSPLIGDGGMDERSCAGIVGRKVFNLSKPGPHDLAGQAERIGKAMETFALLSIAEHDQAPRLGPRLGAIPGVGTEQKRQVFPLDETVGGQKERVRVVEARKQERRGGRSEAGLSVLGERLIVHHVIPFKNHRWRHPQPFEIAPLRASGRERGVILGDDTSLEGLAPSHPVSVVGARVDHQNGCPAAAAAPQKRSASIGKRVAVNRYRVRL